jgi:hypothetical protein
MEDFGLATDALTILSKRIGPCMPCNRRDLQCSNHWTASNLTTTAQALSHGYGYIERYSKD